MKTYEVTFREGKGREVVEADRWEVGHITVNFIVDVVDKGNRKITKFVDAFAKDDVRRIRMVEEDG